FSLRARVWIGAVLWSIGLLIVVSIIGVVALMHHPVQHMNVLNTFNTYPVSALAIAAVSMVLGFRQVRKGLSSLDDLRLRLSAVRDGREPQITGRYPSEV